MSREQFLRSLFSAAIAAADPTLVVPPHLPALANGESGRTVVIGAGKAAASMARAVENHYQQPVSGLVITRYGHGLSDFSGAIEVVEAAHPVPDKAGQEAARRIFDLVGDLGPDDLLLCLISGGGSALLSLPLPGLELHHKQELNTALLKSGATISQMNCLRKHLSLIKGGRLAAQAYPARVLTLAISDVPGDDPAVIASGPTVADASTLADARAVLDRYGIVPSGAVAALLADEQSETPKPGDKRLGRAETILIATPQMALEAAAQVARAAAITPLILGDSIEGEARDVATVFAGMARQVVRHGQPIKRPCVLLSGGETTVTLRGTGRGGRNAEFQLALALALSGQPGISAIAGDTDGIDGSEDNAGAVINADTLARARALGLDAAAALADNDAYGFFSGLDDLVMTGPTLTNVNDFRAILIS